MPAPSISTRAAARIAGVGYVAIFFLAIFANFMVREGLVVPDDAAATVANIVESEGLFRAGAVAFLAVFLIDVVVAWGLYVVFRPANHDLSLLSAWARLVYTVFLGVALVFFFMVLGMLDGDGAFDAFEAGQVNAQVTLYLDAFNFTWLVGLASFGLHLMLVGFLIRRANLAPRALSLLLIAAGLAYIADTLANTILPDYGDYADIFLAVVAVPSVLGEMWLGLWLLTKGGRRDPLVAGDQRSASGLTADPQHPPYLVG
ncbi:MAG: DUF4386 domain-containing protein [Dehalococcoidia bacterium]